MADDCFLPLPVCKEEAVADIVFLVDGSWSIGSENFKQIRQFLYMLVNSFDVAPDQVRIGLVQYSNTPRTEFLLNTFQDKQDILQYINNLPYMGGETNTGLGLDFLLNELFVDHAGSRVNENVPQIAVVITDGESMDSVGLHALKLKKQGITLYAIGIKEADEDQLKEIATTPHNQHVYSVSDFTVLQGISQSLIQVLCTTIDEAKRPISKVVQGTITVYLLFPFEKYSLYINDIIIFLHLQSASTPQWLTLCSLWMAPPASSLQTSRRFGGFSTASSRGWISERARFA